MFCKCKELKDEQEKLKKQLDKIDNKLFPEGWGIFSSHRDKLKEISEDISSIENKLSLLFDHFNLHEVHHEAKTVLEKRKS